MLCLFVCSLWSQAARLVAAHDGLVLLAPQELVKAAVAAFHAEKVVNSLFGLAWLVFLSAFGAHGLRATCRCAAAAEG